MDVVSDDAVMADIINDECASSSFLEKSEKNIFRQREHRDERDCFHQQMMSLKTRSGKFVVLISSSLLLWVLFIRMWPFSDFPFEHSFITSATAKGGVLSKVTRFGLPTESGKALRLDKLIPNLSKRPRKFFLDCGANVGSTYKLFHEIWPNPEEYYMISFEIDPLLAPYYAGFENHTALVPLAVSNISGSDTARLEPTWKPKMPYWEAGLSGSLHTSRTQCNRTVQIPTFDLSKFIQENFLESDELIVKIDIEGAEYPVVTKILEDGSYKYVDKFFIEFHGSWSFPSGWNQTSRADLLTRLKMANLTYDSWEAEGPLVPKSTEWVPKVVGDLQTVQSKFCATSNDRENIKLAIAVGMSRRKAIRVVETVLAHNYTNGKNIGIFLYDDFIVDHADLVAQWAKNERLVFGIRDIESPKPIEYARNLQNGDLIRKNIISSLRKLVKATGFSTQWFLQYAEDNDAIKHEMRKLNLLTSENTVWMPPKNISDLGKHFFRMNSAFNLIPLLRRTTESLSHNEENSTQWLVLNSAFDETWLASVFLLDYLSSVDAKNRDLYLGSFLTC